MHGPGLRRYTENAGCTEAVQPACPLSGCAVMIRDLIKEAGWGAHAAVHGVFAEAIARLYEHLQQPLVVYVVLAVLRDDLLRHMRYEEACVLPLYEAKVPDPLPPARADAYRRDHDLLRRRLEDLAVLSLRSGFEAVPPSMLQYGVSELDELLEHHDEREVRYLYPVLEQVLSAQEQADVLGRLAETGMRDPGGVVDEARELIGGSAFADLSARYRAWLELRDAPADLRGQSRAALFAPLPPAAVLEEVPAASSLDRVLARTLELSRRFLENEVSDRKARVQAERRVDQAWRSLLGLVLGSVAR